jgi:D-alanyl-D-alanine dipeptidase
MPNRSPSPNEPVSLLRRVPIVECGEPLVDYLETCPLLLRDKPVFNYTMATLARKGLAERLCAAAQALAPKYRLAILECWRPMHIQRRMYLWSYHQWKEKHPDWSDAALVRITNRFTAPLSEVVPPPHTTGGAADLTLCDAEGNPLDMISPFRRRDPACYPFDSPGLSEEAKRNRGILRECMESAGVTNYPSEYWHWSYGDQGWAYRGGPSNAIYGAIEPPGYVAPKGDDNDQLLQWLRVD